MEELYGAPLAEFVATRDRLTRDLKANGRGEEAAGLKARRKPTSALWAVNQLARQHPDLVGALVEAGAAVRAAQRRAVSGVGAADLRDAARVLREAVGSAAEAAVATLTDAGLGSGEAARQRVATTLQAAAVDDEAAGLLERGVLEAELEATGFGDVSPLAVVPDAAPRSRAREERLAEARARVEETQAEAVARARAAAAATEEAARLSRLADEAEEAARQARAAAVEARRAAARAEDEAQQAEARRRRAAKALDDAGGD